MTAQEFFKNDRFATNAGVELIEIKEGYSKARLVITAEHLNAGGRTQGGAIFTLADLAPYPRLRAWLERFLASELFTSIMTKS